MATIQSYDTSQGKRYRVRYRKPDGAQTDRRGFRTKRDAELFAADVAVSKARGEYIDPTAGRSTIRTIGAVWLAGRAHLKPSSRALYESTWRNHVLPRWGDWPVQRIEHSDVQAWISDMLAGVTQDDGSTKAPSPSLVRRCQSVLAQILDVAVKDRKVTSNKARGVMLPRKVSREHLYLTHEQVARVVDAAGEYGVLIAFLAYTGLRWGEMSALRVQDINMLRRRVTVAQNAVYVRGSFVVGTPKMHRRRSVPFPRFLAEQLAVRCEGKDRDALVFPTRNGAYMRTPTTREDSWWDHALEDSGLPSMTIHDLRHTAASLAISAGANVKAVQRMLGHASAAETLDTYADLFDDDLDAVASALDVAGSANVGKMWAKSPRAADRVVR